MENGFGKEIRGHRCIAHFNSNFIAGCGGFRFDARLGVVRQDQQTAFSPCLFDGSAHERLDKRLQNHLT